MPRRKPKHTLLSAGASLIGMGLIFLLLPAMLGTRPVMNAVGVNWGQIKISQSALTLRMTQASPTHWHLRLGADAATRQQLSPHVERLRERLRQRQNGGGHTADFDLEDDA